MSKEELFFFHNEKIQFTSILPFLISETYIYFMNVIDSFEGKKYEVLFAYRHSELPV